MYKSGMLLPLSNARSTALAAARDFEYKFVDYCKPASLFHKADTALSVYSSYAVPNDVYGTVEDAIEIEKNLHRVFSTFVDALDEDIRGYEAMKKVKLPKSSFVLYKLRDSIHEAFEEWTKRINNISLFSFAVLHSAESIDPYVSRHSFSQWRKEDSSTCELIYRMLLTGFFSLLEGDAKHAFDMIETSIEQFQVFDKRAGHENIRLFKDLEAQLMFAEVEEDTLEATSN